MHAVTLAVAFAYTGEGRAHGINGLALPTCRVRRGSSKSCHSPERAYADMEDTNTNARSADAVGFTALNIGVVKTSLEFMQCIFLAIFCNALVCMAVWMCYSARSTIDKILAIVPPIAAFVAAGFEHRQAGLDGERVSGDDHGPRGREIERGVPVGRRGRSGRR